MKIKTKNMMRRILVSAITLLMGTALVANSASAAFLFQSDNFHQILSESLLVDSDGAGGSNSAIRFGADATASENGNITWNITTNTFEFDNSVDITGDLTANGDVDFSAATQTRLREDADPNTNAACTALGEVIVDTTDDELQICTTVGTPGVWTAIAAGDADTLDGLDSLQFLRSDASDNYTTGTLTLNAGTVLDVNGGADFSGSTQFIMRSGAANPATCTEGELYYNSTDNVLYVCSATDTWSNAGPQDFEAVYATDADDTLTTSNGNFSIAAGTGEFDVTSTGLIDFNAASFDMDLTGTYTVDAVGASHVTTASGTLTLSTTTTGDVALSSADDVTITAGDDVIFDDAQLTTIVQLTDGAGTTGISAEYGTTGIIDAFNIITFYTPGDGADVIGVEDGTLTNVALPNSSSVQDALEYLDAAVGAAADNNEVLLFYPEYPDTVIFPDGTSNKGTLESLYDDTNDEHFYQWTSNQGTTQDMDLRFRFPLPADFLDVNDFTFKYRTGSNTEADNDVEIGIYNATDETAGAPTACATDTTNVSAGAWATGTITEASIETGCTGGTVLDPGDIIEIAVKLLDNTGAEDYANAGVLFLGYDN